jgi:tRNA(fMet)-specific endonuclease VapC
MNPALLDTDTLSEVLKRRDLIVLTSAKTYLAQHQQFAFSGMTRYEIRRGYLSRKATARLQRFEVFCQHSLVLPITDDVLDQAASLWADARTRGLPDNDADLVIAATALLQGRTLVTGNTAHFSWIAGISLEDWRLLPNP